MSPPLPQLTSAEADQYWQSPSPPPSSSATSPPSVEEAWNDRPKRPESICRNCHRTAHIPRNYPEDHIYSGEPQPRPRLFPQAIHNGAYPQPSSPTLHTYAPRILDLHHQLRFLLQRFSSIESRGRMLLDDDPRKALLDQKKNLLEWAEARLNVKNKLAQRILLQHTSCHL
jgi:hypothetical protein